MSIGFFLDDNSPVMWRGPMLHKALEQFLSDVHWGELETLLVDMPPGTGDVAISLGQLLPRAEVLVVTTPQPAAQQVAVRAAEMAQRVGMRLLGVVENMSWLVGTGQELFGSGGGERLAAELDIPLLGRIPLDPALREAADAGEPGREAPRSRGGRGDRRACRDAPGDPARHDPQGAHGSVTKREALARLGALGLDEPSAEALFAHFDDAERRGKRGHGHARVAWLETQSFDPAARPRKLASSEGLDRWDGAGSLGYLVLRRSATTSSPSRRKAPASSSPHAVSPPGCSATGCGNSRSGPAWLRF